MFCKCFGVNSKRKVTQKLFSYLGVRVLLFCGENFTACSEKKKKKEVKLKDEAT